jgi:hypothetical protein
MKFDYAYSIGQLKPDLILQLWDHAEEMRPEVLNQYGACATRQMYLPAKRIPGTCCGTRCPPNPAICDCASPTDGAESDE